MSKNKKPNGFFVFVEYSSGNRYLIKAKNEYDTTGNVLKIINVANKFTLTKRTTSVQFGHAKVIAKCKTLKGLYGPIFIKQLETE